MKPSDRQTKITRILRNKGRVSVDALVSELGTSPETIRRDLTALSSSGKLQKVHGGAILPRIIGEGEFQQRMQENVVEKSQIAELAYKLISPGDTLFIDTGSTTLIFAEELVSIDNLTIITNSTDIARIFDAQGSTQIYLVGGSYNAENHETVGSLAIAQLKQFKMKYAILTVGGIDAEAGIMDFNIDEAQIAKTMVEQAEELIVLADTTKLNRIGPFRVASLNKINTLVSNKSPNEPLKNALLSAGIKIVTP